MQMTEQAGVAICRQGGMVLSAVVYAALRDMADAGPSDVAASSARWGGTWHCPADGRLMEEAAGQVSCRACDRKLSPAVLYQLVELHPHQFPAPPQDNIRAW